MVVKGRLVQVLENEKGTNRFSLRVEDFPFAVGCQLDTPEQKRALLTHMFDMVEVSVDSRGFCNCLVFDNVVVEQ
jgi:hypothetical protein